MRKVLSAMVLAGGAWLVGAPAILAQEEIPKSCQKALESLGAGASNWQACFGDAEEQSGIWYLAVINLGTAAFAHDDHETAAYYYLLSRSGGFNVSSDITLHAHRSAVFYRTGHMDYAVSDGEQAWNMIEAGETMIPGIEMNDEVRFYVLSHILESLYAGESEAFEPAFRMYADLPVNDLQDRANRAAVLSNIGRLDLAIEESELILEDMPGNPQIENNHCYMLHQAGRDEEALGYCLSALEKMPDVPHIMHSLATVFAALGRCGEADMLMEEVRAISPSVALYHEPLECVPAE